MIDVEENPEKTRTYILIGRQYLTDFGGKKLWNDVFSIYINEKMELFSKSFKPDDNYLESCIEYAEKISEKMIEKNSKEYEIINGVRRRVTNWEFVECDKMPYDGEQLFKKTLEEKLNQ